MSQSTLEWQKAKSEKLLRDQVEAIGRSQFPDGTLTQGMVEAFYAVDLLNDTEKGYWERRIDLAVQGRRQELRNGKHAALFELPALVGGELIAVQDHS
jgi:hypothetical protein